MIRRISIGIIKSFKI